MVSNVLVHYGDHPGTTGSHLAAAARDLGVGCGRGLLGGRNYDVTGREAHDALLWVESGVLSYPTGTERFHGPTAGYLIDVHLHTSQSQNLARLFDLVLVAQQDYVPLLSKDHPNVQWLPLAAPKTFLEIPRRPLFPVSFVGHVVPESGREKILRAVNRAIPMNDWRRSHPVAEMGEIYARSLLVVNPPAHGDVNMRFFEALACGALVVTPSLGNGLAALATEGTHYFPLDFDDESALVEGVQALIESIDFDANAASARKLVGERHTYHTRMADVVSRLRDTELLAPVRSMGKKDRGRTLLSIAQYAGDVGLAKEAARLGAVAPLASHASATCQAATRWLRSHATSGRRT